VRWPVLVAIVGAIAWGLVYSLQLMAYTALNGHPGPTETLARQMTRSSPHVLSVLFSPEHGFFAWTPLALVCVAGLAWLAWRGAGGPDTADRVSNRDAPRITARGRLV